MKVLCRKSQPSAQLSGLVLFAFAVPDFLYFFSVHVFHKGTFMLDSSILHVGTKVWIVEPQLQGGARGFGGFFSKAWAWAASATIL